MQSGTIVDATIIRSTPSTKNSLVVMRALLGVIRHCIASATSSSRQQRYLPAALSENARNAVSASPDAPLSPASARGLSSHDGGRNHAHHVPAQPSAEALRPAVIRLS